MNIIDVRGKTNIPGYDDNITKLKQIKKSKKIVFTPLSEIEEPGVLDELKKKAVGLVWHGVPIKKAAWYPAIANQHFEWMNSVGGERLFIGAKNKSKIDTMFFSLEAFTKKIDEAGGKYATLTTVDGEKINGIVFENNDASKKFTKVLTGVQGRNQENYGFFNVGWKVSLFEDQIIVYPLQHNEDEKSVKQDIQFVDISEKSLIASTKNTVVIAPGLVSLYETYDDLMGEVPAFIIQGINVMLFNYRGYGQSEGLPSEKAVDKDLEIILSYLSEEKGISDKNLILKGICLGAGPISRAAVNHPLAKVILDQTFADTNTFIKTLSKKMLDLEILQKAVTQIGRKVFPHYKNSEEIAKMHNDLCLIINNNDELIPLMGWSGPHFDEVSKNISSLPKQKGQIIHLAVLEAVGHAEGWYRDQSIMTEDGPISNDGRSQVHNFLEKIGFSHDIIKSTDQYPKMRSISLLREVDIAYSETKDLFKKIKKMEKNLQQESLLSANKEVKKLITLKKEMNNLHKKIGDLRTDIATYQASSPNLRDEINKQFEDDRKGLLILNNKISKKLKEVKGIEVKGILE